VGLNLSRAALDASMKYPWPRAPGNGSAGSLPGAQDNGIKFGVYEDDADVAAWVREGAPEGRPCFEAQVMDWSDDVAYSVHDFEDALTAGHLRLDQLASPTELRAVCELAAGRYCDAQPEELEERFRALCAEPYWPTGVFDNADGSQRGLASLKNLTSELIGRFCRAAELATQQAYGTGPLTRYAADLIVPRAERLECALLKGIAAHYVMGRASHSETQARQREVMTELVHWLCEGAPGALEPVFRSSYQAAADDAARLRVVVDQVASLTDTSAVAWHAALSTV
jgi:dGTPase